jgi:hypothetical protein
VSPCRTATSVLAALSLAAAAVAASPASEGSGEPQWAVGERYLTLGGRPVYLMGVNYIPPKGWLENLDAWDPAAVEADLAALRAIGVNALRWFPLWPLVQPKPDTVDEAKLRRIDELVNLAEKQGIHVQIAVLNGWMSGFTFLPAWADGEIFSDPAIVAGERRLVSAIASRYRGRAAVFGYDFGNELNVLVPMMKLHTSPDEAARWMEGTYRAFKGADPTHPVTNGIGTGFDERFDIRPISRASDYMSVHSYPYFHRTNRLDPPVGLRTTYSVNYSLAWAGMQGRPVLVQETGQDGANTTPENVRGYLRVTATSAWADGAAGYLWWCSHAIDRAYRVPEEGVYLQYSSKGRQGRDLGPFEASLGLLDTANRPRPGGREFARVAAEIRRLGAGWVEERPAVYVLVPESGDFDRTMIELITPFTLVKRAHGRARLLYEGREIPTDAAAVVVPGFALSPAGRAAVSRYLEKGGTVYQSWAKDFADAIRLGDGEETPAPVRVWVQARLGELSAEQELRLPAMRVRSLDVGPGVEVLALRVRGDEDPLEWSFGTPFYCRTHVGKGTYFYLAGALEAALETTFDPWAHDPSHHLYEALLPATELRLDNPAVELFHKRRGADEIAVLVNHTARRQVATLRSRRPLRAEDFFDSRRAGEGEAIDVNLEPAGVRVWRLHRPAEE